MKNIAAARALFVCVSLVAAAILSGAPATQRVGQGCLPLTVTSATPGSGPLAGGTSVTIGGSNFFGVLTVTFGGVAATNVVFVNNNTITATTPAGAAPGAVDVVVSSTACGTATLPNGFTYLPATAVPALSPLVLAALAAVLAFVAILLLKK